MQVAVSAEFEPFVNNQVQEGEYRDADEYFAALLHREWKRQLADHLGIENTPKLWQRVADGAEQNAEEDRAMAEEWLPLEEEAYERIENA